MNVSSHGPNRGALPGGGPRMFSRLRRSVVRMCSGARGIFSLAVIDCWIVVAVVSRFWTPQPLYGTDGYHAWSAPSPDHWLGRDGTGADMLSWLMAGSWTDLVIVVLTIVLAALIGIALIAAMVSRARGVSGVVTVAVDALISIPTVLIALVLAVPFGASIAVVIVACGVGYGLNLARIARPEAVLIARSDFVESAVSCGASQAYILIRHILPNLMSTMLVQLSLSAGTVVLAESGLTYLGIGVPSGVPSWGRSLATSVRFIAIHPMTVVWPGLAVTLVVVALNMFGDLLRDRWDTGATHDEEDES